MEATSLSWTGSALCSAALPFTPLQSERLSPCQPLINYVWGFAQDNHLDRERVMMTNVVLAVELCLKAVSTHATFRETGSFKFNIGHDVSKLYHFILLRP